MNIEDSSAVAAQPPLIVERGDWYYVGPIEPALRVMAQDYGHVHVEWNGSIWRTSTRDGDTEHEWGNAVTLDEALRYLLGAAFGPADSEYDEARLRACLAAAQHVPFSH